MTDPITVAVIRGDTLESRHRVHAAVVQDGAVATAAGDPAHITFMRSSAKPLQALALARAYEALPLGELAIACASHLARPDQLDAVRALLARAAAGEDALECGQEGEPPSRLRHNCSGKHAGMLAVCRARGWPFEDYRLPGHPLQRELRTVVADAAGVDAETMSTGTDGCGVVSFALPLERMAAAFGGLRTLPGGDEVAAAMRARPELIRGPGAPDTELMRAPGGWVAKGGAEGLFCAAGPEGLGVALKVEDGAGRAVRPALAALLRRIGYELPQFEAVPVENSRGDVVGVVRAAV